MMDAIDADLEALGKTSFHDSEVSSLDLAEDRKR